LDQVQSVIAQIPGWAEAQVKVEQFAGLTNTNYLVTVHGERFVLRVSGTNTAPLGIKREFELQALNAASEAGIGAQVEHFILPQGHLVTRYIEGHHWEYEEYSQPENLRRVVQTVRRIHALPAVEGAFSPFSRVEAFAASARESGVPFPTDWDAFVERMQAIRARQQQDASAWFKFCHNDLFSVNFMEDSANAVRVIDWEFAGMGDVYFDLAALVYAYDSHGPLPAELQEHVLECYFGAATGAHRERLAGMKYMLLLFTAMWGLLQQGLMLQGAIPPVEGFDYLEYAQYTFDVLRRSDVQSRA
jgi:thiamine kinase-like enzyme